MMKVIVAAGFIPRNGKSSRLEDAALGPREWELRVPGVSYIRTNSRPSCRALGGIIDIVEHPAFCREPHAQVYDVQPIGDENLLEVDRKRPVEDWVLR